MIASILPRKSVPHSLRSFHAFQEFHLALTSWHLRHLGGSIARRFLRLCTATRALLWHSRHIRLLTSSAETLAQVPISDRFREDASTSASSPVSCREILWLRRLQNAVRVSTAFSNSSCGFANQFAKGKCCRQPKLWRQKGFCPLCPHCPGYWGIPPTEFCENLQEPPCRSVIKKVVEIRYPPGDSCM